MSLYFGFAVLLAIHSWMKGWNPLSAFFISVLLTPVTALLFNWIRGVNWNNERGKIYAEEYYNSYGKYP